MSFTTSKDTISDIGIIVLFNTKYVKNVRNPVKATLSGSGMYTKSGLRFEFHISFPIADTTEMHS